MRSIPSNFYAVLDKLLDAGVITWAMAIELADPGAREAIYLTNANQAITHNAQTYNAYPFKVGEIADSGDGNLPTLTITLSNVGRFPMPYLEGKRYDQARVILELLHVPDLTVILAVEATTQGATATDETVNLNLGDPQLFDRPYPGRRWVRSERFPAIPKNRN